MTGRQRPGLSPLRSELGVSLRTCLPSFAPLKACCPGTERAPPARTPPIQLSLTLHTRGPGGGRRLLPCTGCTAQAGCGHKRAEGSCSALARVPAEDRVGGVSPVWAPLVEPHSPPQSPPGRAWPDPRRGRMSRRCRIKGRVVSREGTRRQRDGGWRRGDGEESRAGPGKGARRRI